MNDFNAKLEALSEHHDIPKASARSFLLDHRHFTISSGGARLTRHRISVSYSVGTCFLSCPYVVYFILYNAHEKIFPFLSRVATCKRRYTFAKCCAMKPTASASAAPAHNAPLPPTTSAAARSSRIAPHSHIKGLGLNNEGLASSGAAGFVGQTEAREVPLRSASWSNHAHKSHQLVVNFRPVVLSLSS